MKILFHLKKNILAPLGITAADSTIDGAIKKNIWFWKKTLVISSDKMNVIMKIVQALEDSHILLKVVAKTFKNETEEQKRGFLSMLLCILEGSLLGNLLTGKGLVRYGEGTIRAGYGKSIKNSFNSTTFFNKF